MIRFVLVFAIFFAASISSVICCGPGFEEERADLQEYLGIEWKEHGLDENARTKSKFIHKSSDLDCDFKNPALCRWANANPDNYPDSMDFHLFEKTDHKEFPYVQVRPGPSKVSEGDRLLFAGNTSRAEQSAVWFSSPIFCQNNTGKLKFTYWVYNEALIEVLLLREMEDQSLHALYEKPFIDCGPFQVQDGDCTVEIAPQKEPFIIAIRAYNMKKKEGSFVLIDNVRYNASLCKTSIDLGDDFVKEPLVTSAIGTDIKSASDLDCSEFGDSCRWRNGMNTDTAWLRGRELREAGKWFNATGIYDMPSGQFAMIYIKESVRRPYDVFRSDPIPCQLAGQGSLSFRYWFTREVEARVCTMTMEFSPMECKMLLASESPGPITMPVAGQTQQPFLIAFDVISVNPDFDNFIAIDDIRYEAVLCSDVIDPWDMGASFASATLLNLLYGKALRQASDISCDFEERARKCAWANPEGQRDQWDIGSGPPNVEKFAKLTGTTTLPVGTFAIARFNSSGGTASLLTEPISCLNEAGTFSFRYWQTKGIELQMCLTAEDITVDLDCQTIDLVAPGPVIVDVPPIPAPFRIRIRAIGHEKSTVIVDDMVFQGDICPTPDSHAAVLRPLSEQEVQDDANACRLLSCDFDDDNMCLYKSQRVPGSLAMFKQFSGRRADSFNSISEPNAYVHTRLFPRGEMSVLESPTFALNGDAKLHFNYRRNNNASAVYVCQDTYDRELEECYRLSVWEDVHPNEWVDDYIDLVTSDTKLYIIAKFLHSNGNNVRTRTSSVSIDNIRLTDSYGNPLC